MKTRVLLCGLIAIVAVYVDAQEISSINFSSAEGYVEGPITGQPAGKTFLWQDGTAVPAADHITVENESMRIYQDGSGVDTWTYIEFPNQSGNFTVSYDWQYVGLTDGTIDVGICVSDKANFELNNNPFMTWNEQSVMVRMQESAAIIDAKDGNYVGGGPYLASEPYSYTDGKKISMRYEIDASANGQTFDAFAQKEGEAEVQLADDFVFSREAPNGLNAIAIWMDGATADVAVILDNIVISGPADVPDWTLF